MKWSDISPRYVARRIVLCIALGVLLSQSPLGRDDTDDGMWGNGRSGMVPMTDAHTGCQYLSVSGGITPRMGVDNQHFGCKNKSEVK